MSHPTPFPPAKVRGLARGLLGACALAASALLGLMPGARPAQAAELLYQKMASGPITFHRLDIPPDRQVIPTVAGRGMSVLQMARAHGAWAAINGGYFNHSDGVSASYVRVRGIDVADPRYNRALRNNAVLRPHMKTILDGRSEWRSMSGESPRWAIAPHGASPPPGRRVWHALQAGPSLLPAPALEAEAFLIRGRDGYRDSVAAWRRLSRAGLGLRMDGGLVLVVVEGGRGARGATIAELAGIMYSCGAAEAMALDGGDSASMCYKRPEGGEILVAGNRRDMVLPPVHSALLIY